MVSPEELWKRLHVDDVAQDELRVVLEDHFGAVWTMGDGRVEYRRGSDTALRLDYTKTPRLSTKTEELGAISPGTALKSGDVAALEARVERELLRDYGTRVWREVAFATVPFAGSYRFQDRFQMVELAPDAPQPPKNMAGPHPFMLEVRFDDSASRRIRDIRARRAVVEINLVLAGLVADVEERLTVESREGWAIPVQAGSLSPLWSTLRYALPGLVQLRRDFSPARESLARVADIDHYTATARDADAGVELPESIDDLLSEFYALDEARTRRFVRWAYWLNHSRLVLPLSRSASYTALIQSIEALRPRPKDDRQVTQAFIDFVEAHVPDDSNSEEARRLLYKLRSQLTHGNLLLDVDGPVSFGGLSSEQVVESRHLLAARRLAQLAGVRWLLASGA